MRIVIDMQGAQTESRFRGIGRYTISLAQAIIRNRRHHEVFLAMSSLFPDTIELIREAFGSFIPQENIFIWYTPKLVKKCESDNDWWRRVAEVIREAFLASLQPDVVLISSLFEGSYGDGAIASIGEFAPQLPTVVVLYDLIPLLNTEMYFTPNPIFKENYLRKIESLKKADYLLAISAASALEGCYTLNYDQKRVVNISTAADPIFKPLHVPEKIKQKILKRYGIDRPFVFYSGGADERKNLPRLIQSYAHLPIKMRENHQLVFAGKMPRMNIEYLKRIAKSAGLYKKELVFTGYVSDEVLVIFYNLCRVFVFPSLHEGFGLPVLEAMSCGAAAIGSNITSIPEILARDDAMFDPLSIDDIKRKISYVLENDEFRDELSVYGVKRAKKFSWDESAKRAIDVFEHLHEEKRILSFSALSREEVVKNLINAIACVANTQDLSETDYVRISSSIAKNHPETG